MMVDVSPGDLTIQTHLRLEMYSQIRQIKRKASFTIKNTKFKMYTIYSKLS